LKYTNINISGIDVKNKIRKYTIGAVPKLNDGQAGHDLNRRGNRNVAVIDDFLKLDIRAGEIIRAEPFSGAKKPAYQLFVDFGPEIGQKRSSAQITDCYTPEELVGRQVLGVVNFPPRRIADFSSEVLVLGVYAKEGVVLIAPDRPVENGAVLG
jgi:tRNA-binding protein